MSKINWQYYFARKFSLQRYQIVTRVFTSQFFWRNFGVKVKNMLVKPEGDGNYAICMDKHELEEMQARVFKVVCKDLRNFYHYKRIIKSVQKKWLGVAKQTAKKVNQRLSNARLLALYDRYIRQYQEHFNKPIWIVFPVEPLLAGETVKALRAVLARLKRERDYDRYLEIIFSPEEKNAIVSAQEATLKLALKHKISRFSSAELEKELEKVAARYGFIPCYDVIDAPWNKDYFAKETEEQMKKPLAELRRDCKDIRARFGKTRIKFKTFLEEVKMKKRERELFVMAHEVVFIKDERDDYRRMGSYYGRPLFAEIGRRVGLTVREVCYMTIAETRRAIQEGLTKELIAVVKERAQKYVLLQKDGGVILAAGGREAGKILQGEWPQDKELKDESAKGQVGSPGKARGRVVIVHTKHDLRHVFEGAVMVSVTTNPDFVLAMRKSCAIVTDEGGLTCHAAIVSREMRKPCIVGAKNATKLFQNGDLVEVDAGRGIVRKI